MNELNSQERVPMFDWHYFSNTKYKANKCWYLVYKTSLARALKMQRLSHHLQSIANHGVVVDYGAGDRPFQELLHNIFDRYIAADCSLTNAKFSEQPDVYIVDSKIDLPSNSVDCVVLTEVLEHIFEPIEALQEIGRILKPNGFIIGSVPFAKCEHDVPYDYCRYTSFGLTHLLGRAGFTITELEYIGDLSAVFVSIFTDIMSLGTKALRRARLAPIATFYHLLIKIPTFIYYGLYKTFPSFHRNRFFRNFPLGFVFVAQKKEK